MVKLNLKRWLGGIVIAAVVCSTGVAGQGSAESNVFTIDNRGEGSLTAKYKGAFVEGIEIINTFTAEVDWAGKTPSKIVFELNGGNRKEVATSVTTAETTYNMGSDLRYSRSGAKSELVAYGVAEDSSRTETARLDLWGLALPQWAISMESKKGPINWKAEPFTSKVAFYGEVEVLKGGAGGTINIPKSIPKVGGKWGVEIDPLNFRWELAAQPRFGDGAGLTGSFDVKGTWGAKAACGDSKKNPEIDGELRGEGEFWPEFRLTDVSATLTLKPFAIKFPRLMLLCSWTGCCVDPCPWFQASIEPSFSTTVAMEEGEPSLIAGLKFKSSTLALKTKLKGMVGVNKEGRVFYAQGAIGGTPYIVLQFPAALENYCVNKYIKEVGFYLSAELAARCWWWERKWEWEFSIYQCPETKAIIAYGVPTGVDGSTVRIIDREYLDAEEGYCVFPEPKSPWLMFSVGGLPAPILNVGTVPAPSVDATSDNGLLLFVYDDASKPTGKHQEIYYARWNGSEWTEHAPITDNLSPDIMPAAAIDASGSEIAVWVSAPEPTGTETGPRDILGGCEISFSKYDSVWAAPQQLTANTYADVLPWFEKLPDGSLRVCWVSSSDNAIPVWHDEAISPMVDVMAADWDGSIQMFFEKTLPNLEDKHSGASIFSANFRGINRCFCQA